MAAKANAAQRFESLMHALDGALLAYALVLAVSMLLIAGRA